MTPLWGSILLCFFAALAVHAWRGRRSLIQLVVPLALAPVMIGKAGRWAERFLVADGRTPHAEAALLCAAFALAAYIAVDLVLTRAPDRRRPSQRRLVGSVALAWLAAVVVGILALAVGPGGFSPEVGPPFLAVNLLSTIGGTILPLVAAWRLGIGLQERPSRAAFAWLAGVAGFHLLAGLGHVVGFGVTLGAIVSLALVLVAAPPGIEREGESS